MFEIGNNYTKNDIYRIIDVPEKRQRGAWDKGLREYDNEFFVFANVGIQGRTGHDYNNHWEGDLLYWEGATGSHIRQPSIQKLLSNKHTIFIFTRTDDRSPFT